MGRVISFFLLITIIFSCGTVFAETETEVFVNGAKLECDVAPIIENDRTLVPMRAIFEALGAHIHWDDETKTVTAVSDKTIVVIQIGNELAFVNNNSYTLDVPAQIKNDRTLVPARFTCEALNASVEWDEANRQVNITTSN